jgi:hypothetical protein
MTLWRLFMSDYLDYLSVTQNVNDLGLTHGWSETGFLPILKAITSILTKNPVSWVGVRKSYDF